MEGRTYYEMEAEYVGVYRDCYLQDIHEDVANNLGTLDKQTEGQMDNDLGLGLCRCSFKVRGDFGNPKPS